MNIYKYKNDFTNETYIGFDKNIPIGDSFNFQHFKYCGIKNVIIKNINKKIHLIEVIDLTNELKFFIEEFVIQYFDEFVENENTTIYSLLSNLSEIFNQFKNPSIKKLIGDIGEGLFILELEKRNINWTKYFQSTENDLFDFVFPNFCIDIKTTSSAKKEIKLNYRQLISKNNKFFFIFEIDKIKNQQTIVNVYEKVSQKVRIIEQRLKFWKIISNTNNDLLNSWTINLDHAKQSYIGDNSLPQLTINKRNDLKDFVATISTLNANKDVEYIFDLIKTF